MKNKRTLLVSLLSITMTIQVLPVMSQLTACSTFIRQKDTTICQGASVILNLVDPLKKDSLQPGVWKLLIPGSSIDSNLFNIKPFGFDKVNQYLFSIIHEKIIRFNLKTNTISAIAANNWPGDYTEFTYDYTNKRILCTRGGRDSVYAVSDAGGSWTAIGPGSIDRECYGSSVYWNPINQQIGLYGGYGFNQVKSWIFENNGVAWQQRKPNPPIDSIPPKGGNIVSANSDGTKLYLFSGQGNYSGDELTGTCTLGSPWATAGGMFCWLKDLWELDLTTYQFQNILPVNNPSIVYEGALGYYYDKSRFYLFGGYQPTGNYASNQNLVNTNKTFYFRKNIDSVFVQFLGEGDVPPAMPRTLLNNYTYYDPVGKRMIWARYDGIWAYYPDSTLIPPGTKTILWSTGDTTASITVKPAQTTLYKVTRSIAGSVCKDSINIVVTGMQTSLTHIQNICGSTTMLDAGAGFDSYLWSTGDTSRTLSVNQNKTYSVNVSKGVCTAVDTSRVAFAVPVADFVVGVLKDSVCAGDNDSLFVMAPQPGISYAWNVLSNVTIINTDTIYKPKNIVSSVNYIITAASNPSICTSKTAAAKIVVRSKLLTPVLHIDSVGLYNLLFSWSSVPGATGYQVSLDNGNSFAGPSSGVLGLQQTITGLLPNQAGNIVVKAIGPYACQTSDATQISATTLNPFGDGIYVPTVFTPNGDGVNDVFMVYGTAIVSVRLIIYNQWGGQLFLSTDLKKGWDGTHNGQRVPAGLYTYVLDAVMQDQKHITKGGTFNLIR